MENEKSDVDWLNDAKVNLEDLLSWNDELPEEFIIGNSKYSRHKFRGNWFQGAISGVRLVADICQNNDLKNKANDFVARRHNKGVNTRTTKEEIAEADELIKSALKILQAHL